MIKNLKFKLKLYSWYILNTWAIMKLAAAYCVATAEKKQEPPRFSINEENLKETIHRVVLDFPTPKWMLITGTFLSLFLAPNIYFQLTTEGFINIRFASIKEKETTE